MPTPLPAGQGASPGGLPRYANADIELGGATIAAEDLVLLDLQDANLDPATFAEPAQFQVERADNPHLTFGHGGHYCVGAPLARIELQAIFSTLLRRFPTLQLAGPIEELRPRSQLLTGGVSELPVTW
jgi:cytochrome P450